MTLTASDVGSLAESLGRWEIAEYFACGFVILGCVGEGVADFTNWFTGGDERKKHNLSKFSLLLLVAALALELVCVYKTNNLSGTIIGSLRDKAEEASSKAGDAETVSESAGTAAIRAKGEADEVHGLAASATSTARAASEEAIAAKRETDGAIKEAESLKRDIADEKEELTRLKSNRVLLRTNGLVASLSAFQGTEYFFQGVFSDEESIALLKQIDSVLQQSKWKRMPSPQAGIPTLFSVGISVFGPNSPSIPMTVAVGVEIGFDLPMPHHPDGSKLAVPRSRCTVLPELY